MNYTKPILDIIQERTSSRTYSGQPLEGDLKEKLNKLLENHDYQSPFSKYAEKARFELVNVPEFNPNEKKKLGTYGLIKGAQNFIVGAVEKSKFDREHFGYLMETIILFATDMGLGTCWLGGSFNKTLFAAKIKCSSNEIVPAITSIGYSIQRTVKEKIIRSFVKANKRFSWDRLFFKQEFNTPLFAEEVGDYAELLEMVRLGPSAGNKQPWRIIKDSNKNMFHFYTVKTDSVYGRFPPLDIGIAVCHFDLTAKELGIKGSWIFENPQILGAENLLYKITWNGDNK
ncbi:MAG: nitroreductase [Candidatus Lokiarchaeota archaeon]|nr:nitroreductase [Candidatus Lokiarchaeota archaeon]